MVSKDEKLAINSVRSAVRKSFTRSDKYKSFVKSKRVESPVYKKNGELSKKMDVSYVCVHCDELVKKFNVDHIVPIGKGVYSCLGDAQRFYNLVYCLEGAEDNLQILCVPCHKLKSAQERKNPSWSNAVF